MKMITYKIGGLPSTFKSKPENFERDVLRWKQRNGLHYETEVTILEHDDILELDIDSTSDGNASELTTLSENTPAPKRSDKPRLSAKTTNVQPVHDSVDESSIPADDKSITDWNDYPFESN